MPSSFIFTFIFSVSHPRPSQSVFLAVTPVPSCPHNPGNRKVTGRLLATHALNINQHASPVHLRLTTCNSHFNQTLNGSHIGMTTGGDKVKHASPTSLRLRDSGSRVQFHGNNRSSFVQAFCFFLVVPPFWKPAVLATVIMWTAAAFVGKKKKQATAEAVADSSSASGLALRVSEEEKRAYEEELYA
ncbi:hypothetical protein CPB84DRAFT_1744154 [Gymnopilus junonius]|uniref:Uncharacterized protein n=1 Tax=Gymnopilus junonius TaxID=109634 RepID=A0A9P5NVV0_GYMJU|nr:hypothetical protein CPB84DRAFT_1744154 [Gymnopilus junonius]